jgi:hypothetical protein
MKLVPRAVERPPFRLHTPESDDHRVVLEGVLREPDPAAWLCPLIDDIHARAKEYRARHVALDLRALQYANAAAWKCIVYWLRTLKEDPEAHYQLRVLADEEHRWQKVGMSALRVFGGERLEIMLHRRGRLVGT